MQLVLDTKGLTLRKKRGSFLVEPAEGKGRTISPKKLTSIAITQQCLISSDAVMLALKHEIPILFFDRIGKAQARLWSPYFGSIATLRRQQVRFGDSVYATDWIIRLFELKAEGQISNLKYARHRRKGQKKALEETIKSIGQQSQMLKKYQEHPIADVQQNLMGTEGNIARLYWRALADALPEEYQFKKRSRRPALDIFNATLNYLYGMLYSVVEGALFAAGLDPHLGILHSDEYNKPTLAFDLIEIFRPWVDRLLMEECYDMQLDLGFVTKNQYGLFLNKSGKAYIIPLFNDWLRSTRRAYQRETTVKNHIYSLANRLAQRIRSFEMDVHLEDIEDSPETDT